LYWWPQEYLEMGEEEKDDVLEYLRRNYNIINPKQTASKENYFNGGHYLNSNKFKNESMNTIDIFYNQIMESIKRTNYILEIAYEGNVGIHEMVKFFQVATPEETKEFERLMELNDIPNAWELVQRVVGVRLKGLK